MGNEFKKMIPQVQYRFPLSSGYVVIECPAEMPQDDYEYIKAVFGLTLEHMACRVPPQGAADDAR